MHSEEITPLLADKASRRKAVKRMGFSSFCFIYLQQHFNMKSAKFHPELMTTIEGPDRMIEVIGFRGSAKSTIASLAFPIYAALELGEKYPFIIPIADTGTQAAMNIANIKNELEHNELIKSDYGIKPDATKKMPNPEPTLESDEEWQSKNMLLPNGVRILARSRGQKVRGLKHRQHRPKLITIDDPEDLKWTKNIDNRNDTERWLRGEVMPALDEVDGKLIMIGNFLHADAIMGRAKKWGIFKVLEYPLLNPETRECNWPAKYPDQKSIDQKRAELGETSWSREMLLKVVAEEGAKIKETDLHYYDSLPMINRGRRGHGVDLAISEKETADYTAVVDGDIYYNPDTARPQLYILPTKFHKRCDLLVLENYMRETKATGGGHTFFVEAVAYQKAAINDMERKGLPVQAVVPIRDKSARLEVIIPYIKNGTILFPRQGCQDLISELINFSVEAHDDLCDALVYLALGILEDGMELGVVRWL